MNARRIAAIAQAQGRELLRRRLAVVMLVALPLAFYAVQLSEKDAGAFLAGGIGMGWSIAGAALFASLASRAVDSRLVLAGYRPAELLLGRLLVLEAFALVLAVGFTSLMWALSAPDDVGALALGVASTALVAVPLGLAIAAVIPRELEGMLVLIGVIGVEMAAPVGAGAAALLPLYGPITLMEVAAGGSHPVLAAVVHAVAAASLLFVVAVFTHRRRVAARTWPGSTAGAV